MFEVKSQMPAQGRAWTHTLYVGLSPNVLNNLCRTASTNATKGLQRHDEFDVIIGD